MTSIEKYSRMDIRVIWIDNDPVPHIEHVDTSFLRYIPCPENLGWVKSINLGIALSTAPFVVFMNDDTKVESHDWLDKMSEPLRRRASRVGVCGPRTDKVDQYQGQVDADQGWILVEPCITLDGWGIGKFPLGFFCVMISRDCLVNVGYLDERFCPCYGDDDDWLARAHRAGWRMAIQTDVLVRHLHRGAYRELSEAGMNMEWRAENVKKLREKWAKLLPYEPNNFGAGVEYR